MRQGLESFAARFAAGVRVHTVALVRLLTVSAAVQSSVSRRRTVHGPLSTGRE